MTSTNFWEVSEFTKAWVSRLCRITNIRYLSRVPCSSSVETYRGFGFFFCRTGYFSLRLDKHHYEIDPTCVALNNDGDPWQVSLEAGVPVVCTEIIITHELLQSAVAQITSPPTGASTPGGVFRFPANVIRIPAHLEWLHEVLLNEIRQKHPAAQCLLNRS